MSSLLSLTCDIQDYVHESPERFNLGAGVGEEPLVIRSITHFVNTTQNSQRSNFRRLVRTIHHAVMFWTDVLLDLLFRRKPGVPRPPEEPPHQRLVPREP